MLLQHKSYIGVASPMDWFTRSVEIVDLIETACCIRLVGIHQWQDVSVIVGSALQESLAG